MRDHTAKALKSARRLRQDMSLPEVLLWRILRARPEGLKFRKQHPIGDYVADFYCAERRVIIEIEGAAHDMGDRPERDLRRDERLKQFEVQIVRIPATKVLKDVFGVAESIVLKCLASPPPSPASPAPPPPEGEDF